MRCPPATASTFRCYIQKVHTESVIVQQNAEDAHRNWHEKVSLLFLVFLQIWGCRRSPLQLFRWLSTRIVLPTSCNTRQIMLKISWQTALLGCGRQINRQLATKMDLDGHRVMAAMQRGMSITRRTPLIQYISYCADVAHFTSR